MRKYTWSYLYTLYRQHRQRTSSYIRPTESPSCIEVNCHLVVECNQGTKNLVMDVSEVGAVNILTYFVNV